MDFDAIAEGSGYYRVYVDGVEMSQHTTERKAIQRAADLAAENPESEVYYDHDYRVVVTTEGGIYLFVEEEEVA